MTCIVTGVAGFIGSSLAMELLSSGSEIIGIDCFTDFYDRRIKEKNLEPLLDVDGFKFIEGDLNDLALAEFYDGVDVIYHQAAQAGVRTSWGSDFEHYTRLNILATQRLLESLKGRDIKLVYASSSSVYGDTQKLPMNEEDTPKPVSPYGVSKLAAEHLCYLYWKNFGVKTVSLRYFTVYGPKQRPDMAFHRFIKAILGNEKIEIYGDGEQTRDFTFIKDIVSANISAAQKGTPGAVYNIGGGSRINVNEVIALIEKIAGKSANVNYLESEKGDVRHTFADTSKARNEIGYSPSFSLEEGLREELEWIERVIVPMS